MLITIGTQEKHIQSTFLLYCTFLNESLKNKNIKCLDK